eukprot:5448275-Pleurochrysis_carterae.AAC.1
MHAPIVQQIVFASMSESSRRKSPADVLRGQCTPWPGIQCTPWPGIEAGSCWAVFLAYTPGMADDFAQPALKFTVAAGQTTSCSPPFLAAEKDLQAKNLPPPQEAKPVNVLGIMVGNEQWVATSKSDGSEKQRTELRRFALVEFESVIYFVAFEKLACKYDPSQPPRYSPRECAEKSFAASLERPPGGVHSGLAALASKEKRLQNVASALNQAVVNVDDNSDQSRRQSSQNRSRSADDAPTTAEDAGGAHAVHITPSGIPLGLVAFGKDLIFFSGVYP